MGHAKAILSLTDPKKQEKLCQKIVMEDLSVRSAEKEAESIESVRLNTRSKFEGTQASQVQDPHLQDLSHKLEEKLRTKVEVQQK
ncbi:hypothetical protein ABTH23_18940, partial [Acinetobacter baumannii]